MVEEVLVLLQYDLHGLYVEGGKSAVLQILDAEERVVQPGGTFVQVSNSTRMLCHSLLGHVSQLHASNVAQTTCGNCTPMQPAVLAVFCSASAAASPTHAIASVCVKALLSIGAVQNAISPLPAPSHTSLFLA